MISSSKSKTKLLQNACTSNYLIASAFISSCLSRSAFCSFSIYALDGFTNFLRAGIDGTLALGASFALFTLGLTAVLFSEALEPADLRPKRLLGVDKGDVVLLSNLEF